MAKAVDKKVKARPTFFVCVHLCLTTVSLCGEESYSIQHYDLKIVPNFRTRVIALTAKIDIDNPKLQDSFDFGLNDRYDAVGITCSTSLVAVERANGEITVKVSQPSARLRLSCELKGNLGRSGDENRDIIADSSLLLLWSDRFYPIDFDRWATVRTELLLPSGFQAIAPGRLTKTESSAATTRFVFESTVPAVNFSVFADSRWIKTEQRLNGVPMQTLLYPQSQKLSEQIFKTSSEVLTYFSSVMCPYPFEQFSFVTIDSMYARRAFPGFVGYEPRYLEKEFASTGHDAHETSLLWWGYTTHGSGPGSFQWTEGFGDYVEILYDEAYRKPIPRIFERFRSEYLALPPEEDVPYAELRGNTPQKVVHGKYPWLMHLIRYAVGDSAFARALRLVFVRFRHGTFSMDEFISTLEDGCGQSLRWWREEWLGRKGVPEIVESSQVVQVGARYRITCALEQRGNVYHIPLEIGIKSPVGLKIEKVNLSKQQETFTFEMEQNPTRIMVDPNRWILMNASSVNHAKSRY
jgi:hypothetical protein